jgi:hypothetical protein
MPWCHYCHFHLAVLLHPLIVCLTWPRDLSVERNRRHGSCGLLRDVCNKSGSLVIKGIQGRI